MKTNLEKLTTTAKERYNSTNKTLYIDVGDISNAITHIDKLELMTRYPEIQEIILLNSIGKDGAICKDFSDNGRFLTLKFKDVTPE